MRSLQQRNCEGLMEFCSLHWLVLYRFCETIPTKTTRYESRNENINSVSQTWINILVFNKHTFNGEDHSLQKKFTSTVICQSQGAFWKRKVCLLGVLLLCELCFHTDASHYMPKRLNIRGRTKGHETVQDSLGKICYFKSLSFLLGFVERQ